MEWYLPFTLLSGVGLLVLSTSNFIGGLNTEIRQLEQDIDKIKKEIISAKLSQLKLLSVSIVLQYVCLFLFTLSSILLSFLNDETPLAKAATLIAVALVSVALALLIVFSFRAISIRQKSLSSFI